MAETKSERLEQFERKLAPMKGLLEPAERARVDDLVAAFSRGYDEGFADGFESGTRTTIQVQDFVNDVLFSPRRPEPPELLSAPKARCAVECGLSDDIGNANHVCLYDADEAHAQHTFSGTCRIGAPPDTAETHEFVREESL